jgi:glycosyltransferase involved in cell wall biosynthesis
MMPINQKPAVVFSVTNCICFDQRVLKMAETVKGLDCDITIIGREKGSCCKSNSVPFKTVRFRMLFKRGFLFYKFFNIRLFFYLLFHNFDILVANDLDTLLPNFLVSKIKKLPIVYDSHEYFTGVPEIQERPVVKWVWKTIEKMIFPKLQNVITVSDSISEQYEKEYGFRPVTVRNCSVKAENNATYSREELGISVDHLLLILQGTGINTGRGGEELIDAVHRTENVSLLIVGSGDELARLKTMVIEFRIETRVKFINTVSREELMRYTQSADIGMTLDKNNNVNHNFSLPNKLFDYINAGIPVIASDLTEVRKIVLNYDCGIIIKDVTPQYISTALSELRVNPARLAEMKSNSGKASLELNWETESQKVKSMYVNILNNL